MGKPVLGENCRLEVIIEESYDFKVIVGASSSMGCTSFLRRVWKGGTMKSPRGFEPGVSGPCPGSTSAPRTAQPLLLAGRAGLGRVEDPEHGWEPQLQSHS
jgi:hypothetical protein